MNSIFNSTLSSALFSVTTSGSSVGTCVCVVGVGSVGNGVCSLHSESSHGLFSFRCEQANSDKHL